MASSEDIEYAMDDDFDWAAAVDEIDRACDEANFAQDAAHVNENQQFDSASHGHSSPHTVAGSCNKASRQITLNSFFEVMQGKRSTYNGLDPLVCNLDYSCENSGIDIDPIAARTWVYPANIPFREYQFSISHTALFTNTLVSLPTGLGKTFIAAVVMYNFFRWFCTGKIVFTAPSRPLVLQQIEACHNLMGIPQEWTIDMTGQVSPSQRSSYWQSKRVFFVTPQVLEKDIQSGIFPLQQLVCLVVDEAHRASGNYSYCVVIRELMAAHVKLRVLALTATPGSKQVTIQSVVDNLQISCLEYRDENDPDVSKYIHSRKLELIQVALDPESVKVKDLFLEVLHPVVSRLCSFGVFYSKDVARLTSFEFLTAREKFRQAPPHALAHQQYGEVETFFGIAITLYHIYKLLFSHGMRPAFEMLHQKLQQGYFAKIMRSNDTIRKIRNLMHETLRHGAPSPKLIKLEQIITDHFGRHDKGATRVIIFTNFRESVKDIMEALAKLKNLVKAMEFIGQSSGKCSKGQTQKMQQAVLEKFRAGGYNTIVATSIAEEGLDIMEVDLVICFDANISPIRMIQRMGRTGRKRDGRVVVLASEGGELQGYLKKQVKSKALGKHMHNGGISSFNFHLSPRMVPHIYQPSLQLVDMAIQQFVRRKRKQKQEALPYIDPGQADLNNEEITFLSKYYNTAERSWKPSLIAFPKCQLVPTTVYRVKHSLRTTSMLIQGMQNLQGSSIADMPRELSLEKEGYDLRENGGGGPPSCYSLGNAYSGSAAVNLSKHLDDEPVQSSAFETIPPFVNLEARERPLPDATPAAKNSLDVPSSATVSSLDDKRSPTGSCEKYRASMLQSNSSHAMNQVDLSLEKQEAALLISPSCYERHIDHSSKESHECLFSQGFVEVNELGHIMIASPPCITWKNLVPLLHSDGDLLQHCQPSIPCETDEVENKKGITRTPPQNQLTMPSRIQLSGLVDDSKVGACLFTNLVEIVAATPDNQPASSLFSRSSQLVACVAGFNSSPQIAELNIVYSSPMAEISSQKGLQSSNPNLEELRVSTGIIGKPEAVKPLSSTVEKLVDVMPGDQDASSTCNRTALSNSITSAKIYSAGATNQVLQVHNGLQLASPQQDFVKSSSEDWKMPSCEMASAIKRPLHLKRLRKAQKTSVPNSRKERLLDFSKSSTTEIGVQIPKIGKYQRKKMVQVFIDDEAEVSSDEQLSGDEDGSESASESEMHGFIEDEVLPASSTQLTDDSPVDMMAIYRRSLLTQTPEVAITSGINFLAQSTTSRSELQASISPHDFAPLRLETVAMDSHVGLLSENNLLNCPKVCKPLCACPIPFCNQCSHFQEGSCSNQECSRNDGSKTLVLAENDGIKGKLEMRKRKLEFHESSVYQRLPICGGAQTASNAFCNSAHTQISKKSPSRITERLEVFEDDVFEGLDLDALEAAAAEQCRSYQTQTNVSDISHILAGQAQNTSSVRCQMTNEGKSKSVQDVSRLCNTKLLEEPECLPSFDLGFGG